jgi:LppX_LprAFG lipoprotein
MTFGSLPGNSRSPRWLACLLVVALFAIGLPKPSTAADDAQALLAASATAMGALQSFHFVITIPNGELVILDRLQLTRVEGDVEQPRTLKVSVTGKVKVLPVTANVIIIGDDVWAAVSPREDKYAKIDPDQVEKLQLDTEFDPTTVLLKTIGYLDTPVITGTEDLNGVPTTVVEGTVDLVNATSGTPTAGLAQQPVQVKIWVDSANLVQRLQTIGPLLEGQPEGIVHQLDLSKFNEPVHIVAPS